jgi:hypothetical protein
MNKFEKKVSEILDSVGIRYYFQYFINQDNVCKSYDFNSNIYSNCSYAECMLADSKVSNTESEFSLSNGLCPTPGSCKKKLIISYITIFFVMFFTAMVYVPYMKVTIGCTSSPDMNPLALGIKQLAMTGIGSVPGPIVFGSFIDLTCKYWYTDCLNQKVCKVYTNQNFAFTFGTLGVGFKFICWSGANHRQRRKRLLGRRCLSLHMAHF